MLNEIYLLRPHHGMCMTYFVGQGYSDAFSANMSWLLETLKPDTQICLTVGTDAVCEPCPNNDCGLCSKAELVAAWDREVLELCALGEGYILKFGDFTRLIRNNILDLGLRPDICGGCQWNELCKKTAFTRWAGGA